jgi:hypothetical protein
VSRGNCHKKMGKLRKMRCAFFARPPRAAG